MLSHFRWWSTKQTNKTKYIIPRGIKSEVSLQQKKKKKKKANSKQLPTSVLRGRKNVSRWHVFDVYIIYIYIKKHLSSHNVFTVLTDRSYHSALWGEEVSWSPACLRLTFVDIMSWTEESWLPFDVVLSSVSPFVSSFHICCISAGLRPPKNIQQKHTRTQPYCRFLNLRIFFLHVNQGNSRCNGGLLSIYNTLEAAEKRYTCGTYFQKILYLLCAVHTCNFFSICTSQGSETLCHRNPGIIITDGKWVMIIVLLSVFTFIIMSLEVSAVM